jgi:hypothetical protein
MKTAANEVVCVDKKLKKEMTLKEVKQTIYVLYH